MTDLAIIAIDQEEAIIASITPGKHQVFTSALDAGGVCAWDIWIDVKLLPNLQQGGAVHDWQTLPNEDTVSSWWYGVWSTPRTYNFHVQFLVNGNRLSQEPAHRFFVLLRCCRNLHSFLTIEGLASTFFHLAQAMAMVSSRYFLGSCYRPFPEVLSGIIEVFVHVRCIPHQNSQRLFWASVWFMLDSPWWHEPFGEYLSR